MQTTANDSDCYSIAVKDPDWTDTLRHSTRVLPALIDFAHATVQPPGLQLAITTVTPDARLSLP